MIKKLTLRFGRAPGLAPEDFECTPVTVFVGPNNSGKSKVLQELQRFCTSGQPNTQA
jgi:predicted ATPase